jgi:hypothetical protein
MEGRQRRSFTDDYKRQAVDLVASSGRSIGSVAKELGLRDSVLRRWVELRGAWREPTAAARRPTTQATLPSLYRKGHSLCPIFSDAAIVANALLYDDAVPYPGCWALLLLRQ